MGDARPSRGVYLTEVALTAALYLLTGYLSASWLPGQFWWVGPVWPPTGLALALVWMRGWRLWPGILLGNAIGAGWAWVLNRPADSPVAIGVFAALLGLCEVARTWLALWILRRTVGAANPFDRSQDVFKFYVLAAFVPSVMNASLGVLVYYLAGVAETKYLFHAWQSWTVSEVAGTMLAGSTIICWADWPWKLGGVPRWLELIALVVCSFVINMIVFGPWGFVAFGRYPLQFLLQPLLLWGIFRFGRRGTSLVMALMSIAGIVGTEFNYGPFVVDQLSDEQQLLLVQLHLGVTGLVAFVLTALLHQRQAAEAELIRNFEQREKELRREVRRLRVEIDHSRMKREVAEITETDYFHELQRKARALRRRAGDNGE